MNILMTGGTGLVGSHLSKALAGDRHHVYILSRGQHASDHPFIHYIQFNPDDPTDLSFTEALPMNIDAVYNFAGASINKKWTDDQKEAILHSRINVTKLLYNWAEKAEIKPGVLINASGVDYYPKSETVTYTEEDVFAPSNFLSSVVDAWERQARRFEALGTRVVLGRFGLVLDKEEGVLPLMALPFKFGAGGKIGSGNQYYSWIHVDDLVNALLYAMADEELTGPVNMTSPVPLRQAHFAKYLGMALGRPTFVDMPGFLFKKVLGEQSMLIVRGQKVIPEKLLARDFKFHYPTLDGALDDIYGD